MEEAQSQTVDSAVTVSGLLNTLQEETVQLIQQGDNLSTQMTQLYKTVDDFVHHQMDPISQSHTVVYLTKSSSDNNTEQEYLKTRGDFNDNYTNPCVESGYDSGYNTAQLSGGKLLQRGVQWDLASQVQKVTLGEMSSGSRFKASSMGDPGQEDIPEGSSLDSLDSGLCCGNKGGHCYGYQRELPRCCSTRGDNDVLLGLPTTYSSSYNSQEPSPVTVSSGYSSDSCVREEDIDDLLGSPKSGCTSSALNEDTISCCDSELVRIYDTCKELGRPLSEDYRDDSLISRQSGVETAEIVEQEVGRPEEFVPINYESLRQHQGTVFSELSAAQKESVTYTPLLSRNSDIEETKRKGKTDRNPLKKKSLKRHHSMFERHSKPHICVAQSIDNRSDISPPPITELPGYHPAWCGSLDKEGVEDRHSEAFAVSHCSAFRPYGPGCRARCRSLSEKDLSTMYEVPISVRQNSDSAETMGLKDHNCNIHQGHCEPVYSLVKSAPKRTLTYSCSSDSGNSSSGYCIESQSPALSSSDEGIFESPEQSVLYEPIENEDPIYEYVASGRYSGRAIPQLKDTPPKLPKRNPIRRHPRPHQAGANSCEKTKCTVKLEDIVKPSDIVDTGGKHLYTVADVLASVEKLAQDMPTYANDRVTPAQVCEKLHRSSSCAATLSNRYEDLKGFKRLFSPKSATKSTTRSSSSCKAKARDSCGTVKASLCSNLCLDEKPESVHGLLVIPTHYGLQFTSSVQCTTPPTKVRNNKGVNAGHATPITNCSNTSAISWNSSLSSSSKEIFC